MLPAIQKTCSLKTHHDLSNDKLNYYFNYCMRHATMCFTGMIFDKTYKMINYPQQK